jgi:hypothetical protein
MTGDAPGPIDQAASPDLSGSGGAIDEHVFLVGRPPVEEFLGYVSTQSASGQQAVSLPALLEQWRLANDRVRQLEVDEAGAADSAPVSALPSEMEALVPRILADPFFVNTYSMTPCSIGLVELDRLVVFQKDINLRYVAELRQQLGTAPTPETIFRFALPYDHPVPRVGISQAAGNVYVFKSRSADFRFLDAVLLREVNVPGYQAKGPMAGMVGLMVGHGSNFLSALSVEGRLILNNGSHRAYALKAQGVTHVPCIVQVVSRRDELAIIGNLELAQNADRFLKDPRPPMLKDYFDDALKVTVAVPQTVREVRVSFGVDIQNVPA